MVATCAYLNNSSKRFASNKFSDIVPLHRKGRGLHGAEEEGSVTLKVGSDEVVRRIFH